MEMKKKKKKCEIIIKLVNSPPSGAKLTVGQRVEQGRGTEAAVAGGGARSDLHLVLSGPAEVRQHGLVPFTLRVVALVLAASLLPHEKHELAELGVSGKKTPSFKRRRC